MEWVKLGVLIVGSYLLGAIPWGLMVSLRLGRDLADAQHIDASACDG